MDALRYSLIANQIAITTTATMMAPHTSGVTRFELPLRGESLAAWSNCLSIGRYPLISRLEK
jgi:hypothetical protein